MNTVFLVEGVMNTVFLVEVSRFVCLSPQIAAVYSGDNYRPEHQTAELYLLCEYNSKEHSFERQYDELWVRS